MYKIDELIREGIHIIDDYKKVQHTEIYPCMRGLPYESWMGKVAIYTEHVPNEFAKKELQKLYNNRNKCLSTSGAEKVVGILSALRDANFSEEEEKSKVKVFISHSSEDKKYGDVLLEFLKGLGLNRDEIIYTSNDLYGVPLGKEIYYYLRENINTDVHMIFLLSDNYFKSVACMNEMGATWLAQKEYTVIGIPSFNFSCNSFQDCCIDSKEMGFIMDNYIRITEFKGIIESEFGKRIDDLEWQVLLEKYKENLSMKIK